MAYESLDIRDGGEGERRWHEAGRPLVPSIVVGGEAVPILHVSQLAAVLGLSSSEVGATAELAWQCVVVLDAWIGRLRGVDLELLTRATPSRGRSLRNLTVNVFHPFELLPDAWAVGRFDWDPDRDAEREALLVDADSVVAFAEGAARGWKGFLVEVGDELDERDPRIRSPRGELFYSELVASQRWHADYHYRQLIEFLRAEGA